MKNNITVDAEELAAHLLGIPEEDESLYEELHVRFGCDLHQFEDLIESLLPMIDIGSSPLTGRRFKGFAAHGQYWMAKMEIQAAERRQEGGE